MASFIKSCQIVIELSHGKEHVEDPEEEQEEQEEEEKIETKPICLPRYTGRHNSIKQSLTVMKYFTLVIEKLELFMLD